MLNYYQKNIAALRIQESSIRGIDFDESGHFLASTSDFGFLSVYDLSHLENDEKHVPSRTFSHKRMPFYSSTSTSTTILW